MPKIISFLRVDSLLKEKLVYESQNAADNSLGQEGCLYLSKTSLSLTFLSLSIFSNMQERQE